MTMRGKENMTSELGVFPFGQPVKKLEQTDRSPKKVFVLGVYASAVHATWKDHDGKIIVQALAVASEPYIFWKGENPESYIPKINPKFGTLTPAQKKFNGPSGIALDELFLQPMGWCRDDAWLCDIVPHSCCNQGQDNAIREHYNPFAQKFGLREATTMQVPTPLCDKDRPSKILSELQESKASTIILLGDDPIKWFLGEFDSHCKRLSNFGETPDKYGKEHKINIAGTSYDVLPLVHPRHAGRLGIHSEKWAALHDEWVKQRKADIS